jgi:nicotinamide mononucleotide transporter
MKRTAYALSILGASLLVLASYTHYVPISLPEVLGFITGAICVWLVVKENIWNWPIGIANELFFVILFWRARLFADMGLQFLYIALGFLGWYRWLHGGQGHSALRIARIQMRSAIVLAAVGTASTLALTLYLRSIHDAAPFWDALTTVLSVIAQYLLTKKIVENWHVWIAADIIYVGLYLYKGLALTALLYLIFFVMCVIGAREWRASITSIAADAPLGTEAMTE